MQHTHTWVARLARERAPARLSTQQGWGPRLGCWWRAAPPEQLAEEVGQQRSAQVQPLVAVMISVILLSSPERHQQQAVDDVTKEVGLQPDAAWQAAQLAEKQWKSKSRRCTDGQLRQCQPHCQPGCASPTSLVLTRNE